MVCNLTQRFSNAPQRTLGVIFRPQGRKIAYMAKLRYFPSPRTEN